MNAYPPVVVLGGWGAPLSMLAPIMENWPGEWHPVALDRVEPGGDRTAETWLSRWLAQLPGQAVWIGWSLGGQLAMEAARRFPERVVAVATLCSSPSFMVRPDWPHGMSTADMVEFRRRLQRDAAGQWRRFMGLQILGDCEALRARRALRPHLEQGPPADAATLLATLGWLESLDQRKFWASSELPRLHLLGGVDGVCRWQGWNPGDIPRSARLEVVEGMAHWPHRGHRRQVRERLDAFIGGLPWGRDQDHRSQ